MFKTATLAAFGMLAVTAMPCIADEVLPKYGLSGQLSEYESGLPVERFQNSGITKKMLDYNMKKIERAFRGMPQSSRMNMQHILRHAGLYNGRDDGLWGFRTSDALKPVIRRFGGYMTDREMIGFFEYMLDGGFVTEYSGTPHWIPHHGLLY